VGILLIGKTNNAKNSKCATEIKHLSKSEFEQMVDASNDAVRIIDKDFTIRRINRSFAEMTGVDREENVVCNACSMEPNGSK
jgi:PAS domain-containing protein